MSAVMPPIAMADWGRPAFGQPVSEGIAIGTEESDTISDSDQRRIDNAAATVEDLLGRNGG